MLLIKKQNFLNFRNNLVFLTFRGLLRFQKIFVRTKNNKLRWLLAKQLLYTCTVTKQNRANFRISIKGKKLDSVRKNKDWGKFKSSAPAQFQVPWAIQHGSSSSFLRQRTNNLATKRRTVKIPSKLKKVSFSQFWENYVWMFSGIWNYHCGVNFCDILKIEHAWSPRKHCYLFLIESRLFYLIVWSYQRGWKMRRQSIFAPMIFSVVRLSERVYYAIIITHINFLLGMKRK